MQQHSTWELETYYAPRDIIIAGSGLAGLWSAYYLKKLYPGLGILIVDKGIFASGASTRNAGFACFGSFTELMDDIKSMGEVQMLELLRMRFEGLKRISQLFTSAEIGYFQYGGYELIHDKQYPQVSRLKEDISWLNNRIAGIIGNHQTFTLNTQKLRDFGFQKTAQLVENTFEGQLHSGKLVRALTSKLQEMGVEFMTGTELKGFQSENGRVRVFLNHDIELLAGNLLVCSNAFAGELLPESAIVPARGQVLLTAPIKNIPFRGTFHYDEGYYYFRNLDDRILLGGARNKAFEEERTLHQSTSETIQQELERFLREVVIPGKEYSIENRWSGIMGMAADKSPIIKELRPNCFCALGMGGMGVALAPVVGEKAARLILATKDHTPSSGRF